MQLENLEEVYQILAETKTVDENNQLILELLITDQYGEAIDVLFENKQITNCYVYRMRTTKSTLASLPNKELTNILNDFLQPILQNIPDEFTLANALLIKPI